METVSKDSGDVKISKEKLFENRFCKLKNWSDRMNWSRLKKDIREMAIPLIAISLYILMGNLLFGKICPTRMLFGIPCPGCGTTRAFLLLIQGKVTEATVSNPIWIPIVVLGCIFFINRYFVRSQKVSDKITHLLKMLLVISCILCMIYYIYRMVFWYPDRAPMVYDSDNLLRIWGLIKK